MSKTNKSEKSTTRKTSAVEFRRKITLLCFLCETADIDYSETLEKVMPLISERLGKSRPFRPGSSNVLNKYKINEPIGFVRVEEEDRPATSSFKSEEEQEEYISSTYFLRNGHSLIGDIKYQLYALSKLASPKNRRFFTDARNKLDALAPRSAERVVGKEEPEHSTIKLGFRPSEEDDIPQACENKTDTAAPDKESRGETVVVEEPDYLALSGMNTQEPIETEKVEKAADISKDPNKTVVKPATLTKETEKAADIPKDSNKDFNNTVIELATLTHLPVYYRQVIDEKKVKAAIYCQCTIITHKMKIHLSKKAIFVECVFRK